MSEESPQLALSALIAGRRIAPDRPNLLNRRPVLHPKVPVIAPKPPPNGVLRSADLAGYLGEGLGDAVLIEVSAVATREATDRL